ncbi:hypothetical protein [Saccharopolyspora mangrovi]|uniref:Uncharacterized protein n=1 Tax=Saccharopolyspora mangrovi TaxID=3082379 RepID=A0ABU6A7N9_9PSEU|nr:hypothetical protein [Saccharopolyspora sp. S2-29]MEB3367395.1 hypothetical protein [Saccharopolyspora sp. S2-29]
MSCRDEYDATFAKELSETLAINEKYNLAKLHIDKLLDDLWVVIKERDDLIDERDRLVARLGLCTECGGEAA